MDRPKLPEKPVDRYTLEYWTVHGPGDYYPGVRRHLVIYIQNMSWEQFVADPEFQQYHSYWPKPDRLKAPFCADRPGAPFRDGWILVHEGDGKMKFEGRTNDSWRRPDGFDWTNAYASREDAVKALRTVSEGWLVMKSEEIQKMIKTLSDIGLEFKDPTIPDWIINGNGEIGVRVGGRCFFLYKGHSLEYEGPVSENDAGRPMLYRQVLKREFGECCRPRGMESGQTMDYQDGEVWSPVPERPGKA